MAEVQSRLEIEDLQQNLAEVQELLHDADRLGELRRKLDALHPADIAYILEALPLEERLAVWEVVKADRGGAILIEASDAVRESLIASMNAAELVAAADTPQTDDAPDI